MADSPLPLFNSVVNIPPIAALAAPQPVAAPVRTDRGVRSNLGPAAAQAPLHKSDAADRRDGLLASRVRRMLDGGDDESIERLAFERDPSRLNEFAAIYRPKMHLIPDTLLKRMAIQDDLVAAIIHTRASHIGQFGRKQIDRFSKGFKIVPDENVVRNLKTEQKENLQKRIDRAEKLLLTCGHTEGWSTQERCSFSEYLYMSVRNAVTVGRMATEIVWADDYRNPGKKKFHSFRPVDAGTIYYATPHSESIAPVRKQALQLLADMKNEKLKPEKFEADEYAWVQVMDGRPVQAFSEAEMLVYNFFPTTNVELVGYPLTPMDCAIAAITTHINITTWNKLYFQNGRAAKGMLVIRSDDVDPNVVSSVKQAFNASINSTANAFRMPVFGVGKEDEIVWQPLDAGGARDAEFQYLMDSNARTLLSAFQMSPEELPGAQHLSRGTNSQALSESNNEYKLTAARDVGIRPLIAKLEDHINSDLFALIDPELAGIAKVKLIGLDSLTDEKEAVRLSQDMPIHMTYDEVLSKVEKTPLGPQFGGGVPLNPTVWQNIQQFKTFGEILEQFFGVQGAAKDPRNQFYMNQHWFGWQQMLMQQQQMQAQAQQQQAQQAQQPQGQPPLQQGGQDGAQNEDQEGDLSAGIDQALAAVANRDGMAKSESGVKLPAAKRKLVAHINKANRAIMASFKAEKDKVLEDICGIITQHAPKK